MFLDSEMDQVDDGIYQWSRRGPRNVSVFIQGIVRDTSNI